jgi:hypothetical protein
LYWNHRSICPAFWLMASRRMGLLVIDRRLPPATSGTWRIPLNFAVTMAVFILPRWDECQEGCRLKEARKSYNIKISLFCRKLFARRRNDQLHVQEELSILPEGRNTFTLALKGKKWRKLKYLASLSSFLFQIRPPEGHGKLIQLVNICHNVHGRTVMTDGIRLACLFLFHKNSFRFRLVR